MLIQINTDRTIQGDQRQQEYFTGLIKNDLEKYSEHITRIEVHLSDENGNKTGANDIRCLIEARLEGRKPIASKEQANTTEQSVKGAIAKLKTSLEKILQQERGH